MSSYGRLLVSAPNSSTITHDALYESSFLISVARGFIMPKLPLQYKSNPLGFICLRSAGDCCTIFLDSVYPFFAWSSFVAIKYTSGAPSSSFISASSAIAAASVVLPFFLPSKQFTSLYCLKLSSSTMPYAASNFAF